MNSLGTLCITLVPVQGGLIIHLQRLWIPPTISMTFDPALLWKCNCMGKIYSTVMPMITSLGATMTVRSAVSLVTVPALLVATAL